MNNAAVISILPCVPGTIYCLMISTVKTAKEAGSGTGVKRTKQNKTETEQKR